MDTTEESTYALVNRVCSEVPDFRGFDQLSKEGRAIVEEAQQELCSVASRDRNRLFIFGKILIKIRNVLEEEVDKLSVQAYCDANGISRSSYEDSIRVFELFNGRSKLLPLVPLDVQRQLVRLRKDSGVEWIQRIESSVEAGEEISGVWMDAKSPRKASRPRHERIPRPQRPEPEPILQLEKLDEEEIAKERDKIIEEAVRSAQMLKARISNFVKTNNIVVRGGWFRLIESGLDSVCDGARDWQKAQLKLKSVTPPASRK